MAGAAHLAIHENVAPYYTTRGMGARATLSDVSQTFASLADRSQALDETVQQLVQQNEKLKADLLAAQRQLARLSGEEDCDADDDSRAFGTHLRQAWSILRGK